VNFFRRDWERAMMVRSIRSILSLLLFGASVVVAQAAAPAAKEQASPPKSPAVAPKTAPAESPQRMETPIPVADSNPERMLRDALAATDEARRIVVANLTNADTLGYKRQIVSFTTVLAGPSHCDVVLDHPVLPSSYQMSAAMAPPVMDTTPGKIRRTGRPLDLAIAGEGFFNVQPADLKLGPSLYYTRCGRFSLDRHGRIVLHGLKHDWILISGIDIPEGASNVEITTDGIVWVTEPSESADGKSKEDRINIGTICLNSLPPNCEITPCGDNVYLAKLKKHQGIGASMPGHAGYGELRQGYIEESNVDPQQEFETLRKLQGQAHVLEHAAQLLQLTNGSSSEPAKPQAK
jgi:flagellar basal-body rod protein FlgG